MGKPSNKLYFLIQIYYKTNLIQYYIKHNNIKLKFIYCRGKLRELFPTTSFSGGVFLNDTGFDLLVKLLAMDPKQVILHLKLLFLVCYLLNITLPCVSPVINCHLLTFCVLLSLYLV